MRLLKEKDEESKAQSAQYHSQKAATDRNYTFTRDPKTHEHAVLICCNITT